MIAQLPAEAVEEVGRALHAKLNAPPTARERRGEELFFLMKVLETRAQRPERLPYVPRKEYDARRRAEAADVPPSARLQEKYGTWQRACYAAWGLLADGRSFGEAQPWARKPRRRARYTAD